MSTNESSRWWKPGPLSPRTLRVLERVAIVWALCAIAALVLSTELSLLDFKPGGDAYEITEQRVLGVVFIVAVLVAFRWPMIAGAIAGFAAAALMVFAVQQLEPPYAAAAVIAFLVPGVLWVIVDVYLLPERLVFPAIVMVGAAVLMGGMVAERVYDDLFGPSHPPSRTAELPDSALEWIWSGAVTTDSAVVAAKLADDAALARLAIGTGSDLRSGRLTPAVTVGEDRRVRFRVSGLEPDTEYRYAVEVDGELDSTRVGRLRTFASGPSSFRIAAAACARVGSNGAVFDRIRESDPSLYLIGGDFHYANIDEDDLDAFAEIYDLTLTVPGQSALYRSAPVAYVWDDHDFGGDDSNGQSASRPAAIEAYRRNVPHYDLGGPEAPIYQAFTIGRARVIITDARSARSPATDPDGPAKTMLGARQKAWFKRELLAAQGKYPVILWVNTVPWIAPPTEGGDNWGGYATERREIAEFIARNRIRGLAMISGDAHMLAIDDGSNSDYSDSGGAGFPILHAAALDRPGSVKGGPFSEGTFPGGGQYGLIDVTDDGGERIEVRFSGMDWLGEEVVSHRFEIAAPAAASAKGRS